MTFSINKITRDDLTYHLSEPIGGKNHVSILIGPNGSGKSSILADLAAQFKAVEIVLSKQRVELSTQSVAAPSRVITQTFSPYSRFSREARTAGMLDDYLAPHRPKYVAIGATKGSGYQISPSRDAVERILRALVLDPRRAPALKKAIAALGFIDQLEFSFKESPLMWGARNSDRSDSFFADLITKLRNKSVISPQEHRLNRELHGQSETALVSRLEMALATIAPLAVRLPKRPAFPSKYVVELHLADLAPKNEQIDALIVLTRLGMLRVDGCMLTPRQGRHGIAGRSGKLDLMDASSGQQQLLSSLFSLVAEAENDALILIDEPELSLHPAWQSEFLDLMHDVLAAFTGCHVFVATHSALVAQRARELSLEILPIGSHAKNAFERYNPAASVDQMLLDAFGVAVRDSMYVSRLILSLIMRAERDPGQLSWVSAALNDLRTVYHNAGIRDERILELIADAQEVLGLPVAREQS
ncbi:ATP-binding protein [Duganella phyllosphaerae]|uniref:Vitamin B12 import ATP-binding protein BtuD n=1 Tax=Duganella phyllosphaerae TaxID=762836 RepID=A0A1E7WCU9_9BURK|nr:ATP-binding protein [Duganella phyllosphaerae]OEZ95498.1 vitamin B12 import ATP-binding protein BtuD [Duganella phyllosphaerae]